MIETTATRFTRLEIRASGIVDAGDVRRAKEALESALEGEGRATLLVDLSAVEDVTMKAFGGDALAGASLLGRLGALERVGIVGDASWVNTLAKLMRALPAGLPVRFFGMDAADEARRWIGAAGEGGRTEPGGRPGAAVSGPAQDGSGAPGDTSEKGAGTVGEGAKEGGAGRDESSGATGAGRARSDAAGSRQAGEGLRLLDDDEPGLFVLELDGRIRREDVEAMVARLDELGGGSEPVRVLGRVRRFDGFDPAVLLSPALWRLQREGLSRVSRFALVTSIDWLGRALDSAGRLQAVRTRTFAADDEAGARAWLRERD